MSTPPPASAAPIPAGRDHSRREQILAAAESVIAAAGLRTSVQEIAAAAGILTGSLYHHFASKEALFVELVRRYHLDLASVRDRGLRRLDSDTPTGIEDVILALAVDIARCGDRNKAALRMSAYEAPTESDELTALLAQRTPAVQDAMAQTLRAARWNGCLRPTLDVAALAERLCQALLHVGLEVIRHDVPTDRAADALCRIVLHGLAHTPPDDARLDSSPASTAADAAIAGWRDARADEGDDTTARIRRAALVVFGRKGFEVATLRDIAAVAEVNVATVHRAIGAKEQLLASIVRAFGEKVNDASLAALRSPSSPLEKLDALGWIHLNAIHHFPDEWKIQLAWIRQSRPDGSDPGYPFDRRMRQLEDLLAAGIARGEILVQDDPSPALLTRCVMELLWLPENMIRELGPARARAVLRDDLIRGAARRG